MGMIKKYTKNMEEENKKNKIIEISINLIRLITNKANAFLDKNDIDQAVFEYYKNNDEFGKLFALMFVMDEIGILSQVSKYFSDRMTCCFAISNDNLSNFSAVMLQYHLVYIKFLNHLLTST